MTQHVIISPNARMDLIGIGIYTEKQWGKRQRKKYLNQLNQDCQGTLKKAARYYLTQPATTAIPMQCPDK